MSAFGGAMLVLGLAAPLLDSGLAGTIAAAGALAGVGVVTTRRLGLVLWTGGMIGVVFTVGVVVWLTDPAVA